MSSKKLVWDLPIRLFHWLLVLGILAAWGTNELGEELYHMWVGYFIIGLLLFRLCWGIWGSRHAQFAHFIRGPKSIYVYMKQMLSGQSTETVGHNPLGSLMVVAMLFVIGLQAATGLFAKGELWNGPYSSALGSGITKKIEAIHHANFDYVLVLIGLHILAIFFCLLKKKQNLILPMITGKKKRELVPEGEDISGSKLWIALLTLAVVAAVVYWLIFVIAPPVIYDDYY